MSPCCAGPRRWHADQAAAVPCRTRKWAVEVSMPSESMGRRACACQRATSLNFDVIVCDPREPAPPNWTQHGVNFPREMPDDLILRMRPDARTAVVVLTHDPKLDDQALIDALQSEAFCVGAIGSRRHTHPRRERFALRGPARLCIGSKTLAEIVSVKNGANPHPMPLPVTEGKQALGPGADTASPATVCALWLHHLGAPAAGWIPRWLFGRRAGLT